MKTSKRDTLVVAAAFVATALATGATTTATWSDSADVGPAIVTSGNLDLASEGPMTWQQTSPDVADLGTIDSNTFLATPGDSFDAYQEFTTTTEGDNIASRATASWTRPADLPDGVTASYYLVTEADITGPHPLGEEHSLDLSDTRYRTLTVAFTITFDGDKADRMYEPETFEVSDLGTIDIELNQRRDGEGFKP